MMTILLTVMVSFTQASWIGRTCVKIFEKIAVEDPYQYEQVRTDALLYYYEQLGIKGAWGKISREDGIAMNIMGAELRWRLGPVMKQFEIPENVTRIETDLELYQEFEGQAVQTKDKK